MMRGQWTSTMVPKRIFTIGAAVVVITGAAVAAGHTSDVIVENPGFEIVENPGFETGDLSGWTVLEGDAFGDAGVTDAEGWGWGCCFNRAGDHLFWGFAAGGDELTGRMRSSAFTLADSGRITFMIGGGNDIDRLYVALMREADGSELIRATNSSFDDSERLHRVEWDASEYLGQQLYFLVADEATGGWGHINVDDFQTYHETPPSGTPNDIENAGFETGDLSGWTMTGSAFTDDSVTDATDWGWGCCFGHEGDHHVWGFAAAGDEATGAMTSSTFRLGGIGEVNFLVSGGNDIDRLYVALVHAGTGAELFKTTGTNDEAYQRVVWDASAYFGQELVITVVDDATGGWGHINVDDLVVYNEALTPSLVAYWPFDEGQGTTVQDVISGSHDPINYVFTDAVYKPSTDPLWRTGPAGHGVLAKALLFDGYSTWVSRPAGQVSSPQGGLTVEAWVAPRAYEWGDEGKPSAIVNQHDRGAAQGYLLGMGRHGTWTFQAGISGAWHEVWAAPEAVLERGRWSHVAATFDPSGEMRLYLNGEPVGSSTVPAGSISASSQDFLIGRHNQAVMINGVFPVNTFAGLIDEVKIHSRAMTEAEVADEYGAARATFTDGEVPAPDLAMDRSRYDGDRYRPQYHFMPPEHWMNEPHAPAFACGQYHLFYQHNQHGPYWHNISWGHAVSPDLVSWRDVPVALVPTAGSVAPDGVWSGSAGVDDNGDPVLFITAGDDNVFPNQRTGLAFGSCADDPDVPDWEMYPEPVTVQTPDLDVGTGWKVRFGEFRDPFVWQEDGTWYQLVASGIQTTGGADVGGTALLYSSTNRTDWTYEGPLYVGDVNTYPRTGQVWELPVFLPVGVDAAGQEKHALLINPWWSGFSEHNVKYVWYWVGTWDRQAKRFIPDNDEPRLFDYGEHFTGPSGFVDPDGRSVVFSIAQDRRTEEGHHDAGWAHNAGLPIVLSLRPDGDLGVEPLPELADLHEPDGPLVSITGATDLAAANQRLAGLQGDMLHISLEMTAAGASRYGLEVRRSPGGEETTSIFYNEADQTINVDRTRSGSVSSVTPNMGAQGGPLPLDGSTLELDVFIDKSMIEIYANGHKAITTRVYPARDDALGVYVWADGAATVESMTVWEMGAAYAQ